MTLADFLSSGKLKDLLQEQNILEESYPEWIINSLLSVTLLGEDEQAIITTTLKTDKEKFERAMQLWRIFKLKENKSHPLTFSGIPLNPNVEILGLYPRIEINSNKAVAYSVAYMLNDYYDLLRLNNLPGLADALSAFLVLLEYLAEQIRFNARISEEALDYKDNAAPAFTVRTFKDNKTGYSIHYTDIPYDPESWGAFTVRTVSGVVILSVTGLLLYKFLMVVKTAMIKRRQINYPLIQTNGLEDPMSGLAKMANEVLSLASENAELESKKQAQARKINEKISELRGNDDDDKLISMVDKYLIDFFDQKKIDDFKTIKTQHRSIIKQDENHHNKTHLNSITRFFEGLVNDLFK
jgi:hypothetical protein